ncbi:TauD/TfdA family dioxygenase [Pseudomonas jinjuensis]|uniref:Taurine catabolism dioxygenase TauD, TfdA family n=1 Tax=Pseudomonas jinjuensis TaxID=198616 RepID=A0A1H0LL90_9PSED|nr:TauD/TfdA family dioxygenase [Pseudomonas jinjuensis]SDO68924.1 Taurine catabolism dioxygenase TauD, TfdA family [Pseudomonas jinjuensis]
MTASAHTAAMSTADYPQPAVHPELGNEVRVHLHPEGLPLFVEPASERLKNDFAAFKAWFVGHEKPLQDLLHTYGALRFRGFPIHGSEDFAAMMAHYPNADMGYTGGGTPRAALAGKVFEATRFPKHIRLPLHQEMSYLKHWPLMVGFYCHVAATEGGATDIGSIARLESLLEPSFLERIRKHGLIYKRNFRDKYLESDDKLHPDLVSLHRPWQEAFFTESKEEAQLACEKMNLEWKWLDDGSLETVYRTSGFVTHPVLGTQHMFNQANTMNTIDSGVNSINWPAYTARYTNRPKPTECTFGDGTPMTHDEVLQYREAGHKATVIAPWQSGEVMLVDNILVLHGRSPFDGERNVQVQLFGSGSHD